MMRPRHALLLFASVTLAACSDDAPPATPSSDVPVDLTIDDRPKPLDVAPDVAQPDAAPDAAPDATPDVPEDAAPDAAPDADDAAPDVPVDTGPAACRADGDCAGNPDGEACDVASGRCVRCTTASDRCPAGQYCVAATSMCAAGCRDDAACMAAAADGGMPRALRCDATTHACVECATDAHCADGSLCMGSVCVPGCNMTRPCPTGQACCAGGCVNPQSNVAHCGGCGMACAVTNGTAACVAGACTVGMCTAPNADCDMAAMNGCEVDTSTSVAHCGGCGMACAARANATASCAMGACAYACNAGFADCDMNPANGCEADTRVSADHCGMCGRACSLPNATAACAAGACTVGACATGFGDCDGMAATGCETDTRTTVAHCGACGRVCAGGDNATTTCTMGACGLACAGGYGDCDGMAATGCETDTRITAAHCGMCGRACSLANATAVCAASACAVGACAAGFGDCDGMAATGCEVDTRVSVAHCGGCGRACAAGSVCTAGACAPLASCAAILAAFPGSMSGPYTIDPDGPGTGMPFAVYCDMRADGGGWTMVYKLSSGVAGEPSQLWAGAPVGESDAALLDVTRDGAHYANRILGQWNAAVPVAQARVALYTAGTEVAFLRFNGAGSDRTNWFTAARVLAATWTDFAAEGQNFFQIQGGGNYGRHWFINRTYGGCAVDAGWLVVNGSSELTCDWSTRVPVVSIMYAMGTTLRNWNEYTNVGLADVMAVFVR